MTVISSAIHLAWYQIECQNSEWMDTVAVYLVWQHQAIEQRCELIYPYCLGHGVSLEHSTMYMYLLCVSFLHFAVQFNKCKRNRWKFRILKNAGMTVSFIYVQRANIRRAPFFIFSRQRNFEFHQSNTVDVESLTYWKTTTHVFASRWLSIWWLNKV